MQGRAQVLRHIEARTLWREGIGAASVQPFIISLETGALVTATDRRRRRTFSMSQAVYPAQHSQTLKFSTA